jgi:two-component system, NarL family, response regulator NreC
MLHNDKIKVVIADDHEIFRDGLRVTLQKEKKFEVIGEAANGFELIDIVNATRPDVVITDIVMPKMDGIEATRNITATFPAIGIIGLSMLDEDRLVLDILEAGALGYLVKNADKAEIFEAIQTVNEHQPYYCRLISTRLVTMIARSGKFNPYKNSKVVSFNENEMKIIEYICKELTSKEIAHALELSTRTVEGYRTKIMEKIDVKTPAGIAIYAIKQGLYKI